MIGDRPPDHHPAPSIQDDGHVHLPALRGVLGDVAHPKLVRSLHVEAPHHQVLRELGFRVAPGASTALAPVDALDPGRPHEAGHPFSTDPDPLAQAELCVHPRGSVGAAGLRVDLPDPLREPGILDCPR